MNHIFIFFKARNSIDSAVIGKIIFDVDTKNVPDKKSELVGIAPLLRNDEESTKQSSEIKNGVGFVSIGVKSIQIVLVMLTCI